MKLKSLVNGLGNHKKTKIYYDDWSQTYDETLKKWNYKAPNKVSKILKLKNSYKPKSILDLACGTGLFAEEVLKIYPFAKIDGIDISRKILNIAKSKKIYRNLIYSNFDNQLIINNKYDLISCIGAMTYTKDPSLLLKRIYNLTNSFGSFIFTHRTDLWERESFLKILYSLSLKWKIKYISRPILYLPKNSDFKNKIKIKIVLLNKV